VLRTFKISFVWFAINGANPNGFIKNYFNELFGQSTKSIFSILIFNKKDR
jgi:hypothetical protein